MKAKNRFTRAFCDKTGDRIFLEIEITGNPDEVCYILGDWFGEKKEVIQGAALKQIFFKKSDINTVITTILTEANNKVIEALKDVSYKADELNEEVK